MNSTNTFIRTPVIETNVLSFKKSEPSLMMRMRKPATDLTMLPRYDRVGTGINNPSATRDNFEMQPCTETETKEDQEEDIQIADTNPYQQPGLNFTNLNGVYGIRQGQSLEARRNITSNQFLESELSRRSDSIYKYREYFNNRRKPDLSNRGHN
jgi:hypothetical protein